MEMCSGAALVTDKQWALLPEEPFVMRCGSFCGPRTLSSGRHSKAREKTDIAKSCNEINCEGRIRRNGAIDGSNKSDGASQVMASLLGKYAFQNCLVTTVPVIKPPVHSF